MDVIFGLLCFGFLLYFLVINPIKESNERKEREKQQEQQRQRHERIEAANKLMLKYRKGASSLCKKHPEWQAEDFYYHSNEVIAEHHRIEAEGKKQRSKNKQELKLRKNLERRKEKQQLIMKYGETLFVQNMHMIIINCISQTELLSEEQPTLT